MENDAKSINSKKRRKSKKLKVGELLTRTANLMKSPDDLSISTDRLKLIAEHDYDSDDNSSLHSGSKLFSLSSWRSQSLGALSPSRGSSLTDSSEYTMHILTNRELIEEIKKRAMKDRRPPDFVPSFESLDASSLSWNKKLPKEYNKEDPPVNIIGCMHPLELVLAKADKRLRKQAQTLHVRQIKCEEKTKAIDDAIKWKFSRAERHAEMIAYQQLQIKWSRIIFICKYFSHLAVRFHYKWRIIHTIEAASTCANVIQRAVHKWYRKNLMKKIQYKFAVGFSEVKELFRFYLQMYRKKRAVTRIRKFLYDFRNGHKMSVVVHRYLAAVRKVQAAIRDFLHCKEAKIITLSKIWEKLEMQYIRKKYDQKKAHIQDLKSAKKSSDQRLGSVESSKTFMELKQQDQTWAKIDSKMQSMVSILKASGVIVEEDEEEIIRRMLIPDDIRKASLRQIVERSRKDFYAGQRTMAKKLVDLDSTFKEHHAKELLMGKTQMIERIINDKFSKSFVVLKYKPFLFFRSLDKRTLWDKIREIHYQKETFKIKVDKVAESPMKRRDAMMKAGSLSSKMPPVPTPLLQQLNFGTKT